MTSWVGFVAAQPTYGLIPPARPSPWTPVRKLAAGREPHVARLLHMPDDRAQRLAAAGPAGNVRMEL